MNFKVDKHIEAPRRSYKYPDLNIGESFFVPCAGDELDLWRSRLVSFARNRRYKHTIRAVDGGLRIWRLE